MDDLSNNPGFAIGQVETQISIDPDGGVTISVPAVKRQKGAKRGDFNENLADRDDVQLSALAEELLEGIDIDRKSRNQFVSNYTTGMKLLGLEIKQPNDQEKTSQVGHPLLLEAIIRAQSASGGELMPPTGPCKCETPGGSDGQTDEMARAFETDMNTYLTHVASEYYPDMDRGLFGLFYGGNMFKKVYNHPLRRRPVADTINIADLIVSEDATDLDTAIRVSHRSEMTNSMVRRMQRFGDWREVDLGIANRQTDPMRLAQMQVDGVNEMFARPQDVPHEIYEVTAELDMSDYGLDDADLPDVPLSWVITLDTTSRQILAIRRGWVQGDDLFRRRQRYVHYGMIPSFRFLCLGFVHLLGNQTQVLRGIWRTLATQGMFANLPGGMKVKGVRLGMNDVRPGPGEWVDIDLGAVDDIKKAIMPMPYKDVSVAFLQLAEQIGEDAQRMAGVVEQLVGNGLTNVPVGTMMSMVEIATQPMSAVHKRLHRAQARELAMLKECFAENPAALAAIPNVTHKWSRADEFANITLLPASDPNVPSQIHRIQLATALITVASQNPMIYDQVAVHKRAWGIIGVQDADSFVVPQPAPPQPPQAGPAPPDPLLGQARMLEAQVKMQQATQQQTDMQRKAAVDQLEAQSRQQEVQLQAQENQANIAAQQQKHASDMQIEKMRMAIEMHKSGQEHQRESAKMQHDAQMQSQDHSLQREQAASQTELQREQHAQSMQQAEADRQAAGEQAQLQAKTSTEIAKMKPKPAASGQRATAGRPLPASKSKPKT